MEPMERVGELMCVCVYLCVHACASTCICALMCVSAHICATFDHVCMDALAPVRVHGRSAWSTRIRGVWCTARRARVCFSIPRERVWVRATRAAHECRSMYARGTYVRTCVRVRAFAHAYRLYVRVVACVPLCVHVHTR